MELKNPTSLRELFPLKKTITQLLISISIFSLVFFCSSLFSSTLPYYPLRNMAVNKNCIFLICNGILVILAKTSAPPSGSDIDDILQKRIGGGLQLETQVETLSVSDKHIALQESDVTAEDSEAQEVEENGGEEMKEDHEFEHSKEIAVADEVAISIAESDGSEDDENELQNLCLLENVEDRDRGESSEGEEIDEIEKLSTEELNQKFEDFIRRMKKEFRVNENQQQLVVVK